MFLSSSTYISRIEPNELNRLKSGRPASRVEILERHLKEQHIAGPVVTHEQPSPDETPRNGHPVQPNRSAGHATPNPVVSIRRSISRVLVMAAERIGPEAA